MTFKPQISKGTRQIMESKRQGNIVGSLVDDANRRKVDGKRIRAPMSLEGRDVVKSKSSSKITSPIVKNAGAAGKSSSDLLLKRFDNDLR